MHKKYMHYGNKNPPHEYQLAFSAFFTAWRAAGIKKKTKKKTKEERFYSSAGVVSCFHMLSQQELCPRDDMAKYGCLNEPDMAPYSVQRASTQREKTKQAE